MESYSRLKNKINLIIKSGEKNCVDEQRLL